MADYAPVAAQTRQPQQMSLGEMVNMANAMQSYQQARQLNPLQLEMYQQQLQQAQQLNPVQLDTARSQLSRLNQLTPLEVSAATSAAGKAGIEYNVAGEVAEPTIIAAQEKAAQAKLATQSQQMDYKTKIADKIHSGNIAMINDPDVIQAELNPQKANTTALKNKLMLHAKTQAQSAGISEDQIPALIQPYMDLAQNNPGQLRQFMKTRLLAGIDGQAKATLMQPAGIAVNTGAEGKTVATGEFAPNKPGATLPGTSFTAQLAPGQRYEATGKTDMSGNPTAYVKDANGRILGETTIPAGVNPAPAAPAAAPAAPATTPTAAPTFVSKLKTPEQVAQETNADPSIPKEIKESIINRYKNGYPAALAEEKAKATQQQSVATSTSQQTPTNAPVRARPGTSAADYTAAGNLRTSAREAASQYPNMQFTNNQIIDLANKTITGVGAETLSNLAGKIAVVPWTGNQATYFDQLGHYMTQQQTSLAKSAGLSGTDQANALAGQLTGTTQWTPEAIKSAARVNRAMSLANSMFHQGIENKQSATNDQLAPIDFQSQWSKVANINAIRLHDAVVNGDKEGIKEVINAVDPTAAKLKDPMQSVKVQFLLKQWAQMNKLVKGQ